MAYACTPVTDDLQSGIPLHFGYVIKFFDLVQSGGATGGTFVVPGPFPPVGVFLLASTAGTAWMTAAAANSGGNYTVTIVTTANAAGKLAVLCRGK